MKQARDIQFEYVRVIATLWIVGVWHMPPYVDTHPSMTIMGWSVGYVTTCMLATFMFMSGYFLSKYTFETKTEIVSFYKKRLTRFFPLFFLSALLLYRLGFNPHFNQFIFTVTGLSSYFGHQSMTIWFISMLFSFYMVTPLVVRGLEKIKYGMWAKACIVVLFSIAFIYALSCTPLDYDVRLSYTMPFYGLGLVFGRETIIKTVSSKWYALVMSAALLCALHKFDILGETYLHIDTVVAIVLFFCVCYWLKYLPLGKVITLLSYATMAMYLFHRPIFHLTNKYVLNTYECNLTEFYIILMPIMIFLSYVIQLSYDFSIKMLSKKES